MSTETMLRLQVAIKALDNAQLTLTTFVASIPLTSEVETPLQGARLRQANDDYNKARALEKLVYEAEREVLICARYIAEGK